MHKKNGRRVRLYERIADFCEVPDELVARVPVFVLRGRHQIEISGASGITEYSDSVIVLSVGRDKFTVRGMGLTITDFREAVICVRGDIVSAAFEGSVEGC